MKPTNYWLGLAWLGLAWLVVIACSPSDDKTLELSKNNAKTQCKKIGKGYQERESCFWNCINNKYIYWCGSWPEEFGYPVVNKNKCQLMANIFKKSMFSISDKKVSKIIANKTLCSTKDMNKTGAGWKKCQEYMKNHNVKDECPCVMTEEAPGKCVSYDSYDQPSFWGLGETEVNMPKGNGTKGNGTKGYQSPISGGDDCYNALNMVQDFKEEYCSNDGIYDDMFKSCRKQICAK